MTDGPTDPPTNLPTDRQPKRAQREVSLRLRHLGYLHIQGVKIVYKPFGL